MDTVLEMKHITKRFGGVTALSDVSFTLEKGQVHALIGENGAGKSTLMKILLGYHQPDAGEIIYKGKQVHFAKPKDALVSGVAMIHQEISLMPAMSISENVWVGREKQFMTAGIIQMRKQREATQKLLDELEIQLNPRALVKTLSIAAMQLVEIVRAVSYDAEIIIMDEPTSALTDTEINLLYKIVRMLAAKGKSVIFISHKLEEIFEICDQVTVLRDGKFVETSKTSNITQERLISLLVGREVKELFPKQPSEIGEVVLKVEHLTCGSMCRDVSFYVRRGEILGLCGLMGAGRTEILRALMGVDRPSAGTITLNGERISIKSPKDAVRNGIGMVTEDRLRLGILHNQPIRVNMATAYLYKIAKAGFVRTQLEKRNCENMADKLQIKLNNIEQLARSLSGGNQQKVVIGKWLLAEPKVMILDEPTRGIDVGSKSEIHRLMSQLAQQGMAIIMVSSELPEVLGMSDRVHVVRKGQIVHEANREDFDQEKIMAYAFN